jgi:hypothetical protein
MLLLLAFVLNRAPTLSFRALLGNWVSRCAWQNPP